MGCGGIAGGKKTQDEIGKKINDQERWVEMERKGIGGPTHDIMGNLSMRNIEPKWRFNHQPDGIGCEIHPEIQAIVNQPKYMSSEIAQVSAKREGTANVQPST